MPITADRRLIKRLLSKHGEEASRQLIELHRADTLGQSSICIPRLATFETANAMIDELLQEEKCFSLKDLAVNGNDMMAIGLKGKSIGNALQACLDAVMDERVANDHTALLTLAQEQMQTMLSRILDHISLESVRATWEAGLYLYRTDFPVQLDAKVACWYGEKEGHMKKAIQKLRKVYPKLTVRCFSDFGHGDIINHPELFVEEMI